MNLIVRLLVPALVCAGFIAATGARAEYLDPVSGARLVLSPDPVPVNLESSATLFILTRADVHGFNEGNEPVHVPPHQIVGQRLDLFFSTSCSFICQNLPTRVISHPFRLPPLSEGMHTVRILADAGPEVLAVFSIPVGGVPTGTPAPVSLPVGGGLTIGLLAILLVSAVWIRRRTLAVR